MDPMDEEKSNASITVVQIRTPKTLEVEQVLSYLKGDKGENGDKERNGITCKFGEETILTEDGNERSVLCDVVTIGCFKSRTDINNGDMEFCYWKSNNGTKVYALLQSKKSNAWTKLYKLRNTKFPHLFTKTFLNPKQIKAISAQFLLGRTTGVTTMRYADLISFHESDVMRRYGVVRQLEGNVCSDGYGKQLREHCNIENNCLVTIQAGQVKLSARNLKRFDLLKFIDASISTNNDSDVKNTSWDFLTYIESFINAKKLNANLLKELFNAFQNGKDPNRFKLDNFLVHERQDFFDSADVELKFNDSPLRWKCGLWKMRGKGITVREVLDSVETKLKNEDDIGKIKLVYYDYATNQYEERSLGDLLIAHLRLEDTDDDGDIVNDTCFPKDDSDSDMAGCYFKYGSHWYKVKNDFHLQLLKFFITAVQETLMTNKSMNDEEQPSVLPWCTSHNKECPPTVSLTELLKHTTSITSEDTSEEFKQKIKDIEKILTTDSPLINPEGNDFLGKGEADGHDGQLLNENLHILPRSVLGEAILKCSGMQNFGEKAKHSFMLKIQQALQQSSNQQELKQNLSKYLKEEAIDKKLKDKSVSEPVDDLLSLIKFNNKDKESEIRKTLKEEVSKMSKEERKHAFFELAAKEDKVINEIAQVMLQTCRNLIKRDKDSDRFLVCSPFLTKTTWSKIHNLNLGICPVKLIQYLRMHTPMSEGDYNELYHLSNCYCSNSNWKYIVGDRVLDVNIHYIELFDVMAYNKDKQKAYLLHVKKGFDASAYRDVCSQVQVCGEEIWSAVTSSSENTIFEKFFDVATAESNSVHRQLTKREVEKYIAPDKETFLKQMLSNELEFFVCIASCTNKYDDLEEFTRCQLNYSFKDSDFNDNKVVKILKEEGFIDKITATATGKSFCTKKKFVAIIEEARKGEIDTNTIENVHDIIQEKTNSKCISSHTSFIAKASLAALHERFAYFLTMPGKRKMWLKVIKVRDNSTSLVDKTSSRHPWKEIAQLPIAQDCGSRKNGSRKKRKSTGIKSSDQKNKITRYFSKS